MQLFLDVKALRRSDTLVVWKFDRLSRDLRHLVNIVHDLTQRGIGLKVLSGTGRPSTPLQPLAMLVLGILAALAEFERERISESTIAGLAAARARGRKGGRPYKMTPAKVRLERKERRRRTAVQSVQFECAVAPPSRSRAAAALRAGASTCEGGEMSSTSTHTNRNTGRWYLGRVLGNRAARVTVLLVALAFAGGFWLLTETGMIEPGSTVAIIGVVLFVIVAAPLGMLVGGSADKAINPEQ